MSTRFVKVLHVEDERLPRAIVANFLGAIEELQCQVVAATSEEEALERFAESGFELVLLDYQLAAGSGLSCLQRIRQRDGIIPIIAISGHADPAVAAELLRHGADLFLSKNEISAAVLANAVRASLRRADAWRCAAQAGDGPNEGHPMPPT
ncbi:MAG: response regulator [Pirellulales bacterium]